MQFRSARIRIVFLTCVLAFATVEGQEQRDTVVGAPTRGVADSLQSSSRARSSDSKADGSLPKLVFTRDGTPRVRITGAPALAIIVGFFGGLIALVWRLLHLRQRARLLAARSATQYRALFERNPCPMFVYDTRSMAILKANRAASSLLGYTSDAFERLTLGELFQADSAADGIRALRGVTDTDENSGLITCMLRKDGSCIDVDARGRPLDEGDTDSRLVTLLDVTERLSAELALRDAEQRARATSEVLRSLIEVAPQAIIALDNDYRVTLWNRAAESLFGWTAKEVVGDTVPYLRADQVDGFVERQRVMAENGVIAPAEITRMRKDGTRVEVLAATGVVNDAEGALSGYIGIFTDLTQHRLLEAQLRQSQKLEAVGRLAGGIAHDFNNMLTVISSYVEMLRGRSRSIEDGEDLAEIAGAATRAANLTRQLLTFSRKQTVQFSRINVNDVIAGIEPMLRRVSAENIHVRTSLAHDPGLVLADAGQLEQVILNLAVNASDAMPDGGTLAFETRNVELNEDYALVHPEVIPGLYVMLATSDTGCGMNEATQARIFEPFFTTKELGRGTGLGLAMAYEIVRQAAGHISVYSEVGSGTTFKIFLPRVDAAAAVSAVARPTAAVGSGGTVLLVDDDEAVRRTVRTMLVRRGYVVLEASAGESGLAVVERQGGAIDIVVTDLVMPGMGGREFADRLAFAWPHLRVVFTSGYTDDDVVRRRLVAEGQPFLQKPFTSEQLVSVIEAVQQS